MSKYDWRNVHTAIEFISTELVGRNLLSWGYRNEPSIIGCLWFCDQGYKPVLIGVNIYKGDWRDSLEKRPCSDQ